ncbi:MAG: efflux RND transporter permease subunit [Bacteroidota bacterium]
MKGIITFFIKYPIMVNLGVILIVFLGLTSLNQSRTTLLPQQPVSFIDISVLYRGASPQEVEEGITLKIEDNLEGITGIERVTSTSAENLATIAIELIEDADANIVIQDINNAVDKITTFPQGIDEPVVLKRDVLNATINFAIVGDVPLQILKDYAQKMEAELLKKPGISQVFLKGFPDEEIEVRVSELKLREYNLTFSEVADAIQNANLESSGGELVTDTKRMLIRADEKNYYARDLNSITVKADPFGDEVKLGDIATLVDRFEDEPVRHYVDGKQAVVIEVFSLNEEDILGNAETINQTIDTFNTEHEGVEAIIIEDSTINLNKRIQTLSSNGIVGAILVLFVLALFLDKRLAFWVALKIPVALLGMLILSNFYDLTINLVSMFGGIIVLGILVDDGVVISENIFQHYKERGKNGVKAALDGTLEVVQPVFSSLTTTAVAFCLFFFIDGTIGDFFSDVAFVVVATLIVAMLDSFFLIPSRIAHSKALQRINTQTRFEKAFNDSLVWVRERIYRPLVEFTVHRFSAGSISLGVVLLMLVISLISKGIVGVTFFPNIEQDVIVANLELVPGTHERITENKLQEIEAAADRVNARFYEQNGERNIIKTIERIIGPKSHEGSIRMTLIPGEEREILSFEVANAVNSEVGEIQAAENFSVGYPTFIFGKPISIALVGEDLADLRAAKNELRQVLIEDPRVKDIVDTDRQGITEIGIKLKPQAELLGLSLGFVMEQVRAGFFGIQAQSLQRGDEEVIVWVRYDDDSRSSVFDLSDMRIQTQKGESFPLRELADLEFTSGVLAINHQDKVREIRVEADISDLDIPVPTILAELEEGVIPTILARYPGVEYTLEGQSRESGKAQASARKALPIFLITMLSLIIINFKSFGQAGIVVSILPFALIGVVIGHVVHGIPLSIFSGIGMIALIGVLINNSLVFMDTFNERLKEGLKVDEAIIDAAKSRFRAIILTTITTVAGLGPLIGSGSLGAQFLKPPAITIAYGLAFGTLITLIILPSMLHLNSKIKVWMNRFVFRNLISAEELEPAVKLERQSMGV